MSKHTPSFTPGPWEVQTDALETKLHTIWHRRDGFILVARTCFAPNSEANARIIAAAPRLLEALQRLADFVDGLEDQVNFTNDGDGHYDECRSQSKELREEVRLARAAIAEAEGEV